MKENGVSLNSKISRLTKVQKQMWGPGVDGMIFLIGF